MAIKNIDELAKFVELEEGKTLTDILASDEEVEIKLNDNLVIRTKEEAETLETNIKNDSFGKGETTGRELVLKEMKETLGLDFEGRKDPNKFIDAFKSHVLKDAEKEPNEKIEELTKDITSLQTKLVASQDAFKSLEIQNKKESQQSNIDEMIMDALPENAIISKKNMLTIFKSGQEMELDDKKLVFRKNGEILKDDLKNPLGIESVVKTFSEPFIAKTNGGGDGGDEPGNAKAGSFEAFEQEMKDNNVNAGSLKFNQEITHILRYIYIQRERDT